MQTLEPKVVNLFVKCWTKEREATVNQVALIKEIEAAELSGAPTTRLRTREESWADKGHKATEPLIPLIEDGTLPRDAPELCAAELGDILPYVGDCYGDLYRDYAEDDED